MHGRNIIRLESVWNISASCTAKAETGLILCKNAAKTNCLKDIIIVGFVVWLIDLSPICNLNIQKSMHIFLRFVWTKSSFPIQQKAMCGL